MAYLSDCRSYFKKEMAGVLNGLLAQLKEADYIIE